MNGHVMGYISCRAHVREMRMCRCTLNGVLTKSTDRCVSEDHWREQSGSMGAVKR